MNGRAASGVHDAQLRCLPSWLSSPKENHGADANGGSVLRGVPDKRGASSHKMAVRRCLRVCVATAKWHLDTPPNSGESNPGVYQGRYTREKYNIKVYHARLGDRCITREVPMSVG